MKKLLDLSEDCVKTLSKRANTSLTWLFVIFIVRHF